MAWEFWESGSAFYVKRMEKPRKIYLSNWYNTANILAVRDQQNRTSCAASAEFASYYNVSTDYLLGRIDYPKIAPEFSNSLIQNVTIGDFVCRIDSFNSKSKRLLVDYVNYLTYMENTEKLKKDDKTKNPIQ